MPTGITAVVLAAGAGSRFEGGAHKLRAELRGVSVVRRSVESAVAAGIGPVLVVTGAVELADLLPLGVTELRAADWSAGQSHSLGAAVAAVAASHATAMVVGLADMPFVTPEAWRAVAGTPGEIVVASYGGRRRPPVKLGRSVWADLPSVGDEGARALMRLRPDLVRDVAVDGDDRDIDTLGDLHDAAGPGPTAAGPAEPGIPPPNAG